MQLRVVDRLVGLRADVAGTFPNVRSGRYFGVSQSEGYILGVLIIRTI